MCSVSAAQNNDRTLRIPEKLHERLNKAKINRDVSSQNNYTSTTYDDFWVSSQYFQKRLETTLHLFSLTRPLPWQSLVNGSNRSPLLGRPHVITCFVRRIVTPFFYQLISYWFELIRIGFVNFEGTSSVVHSLWHHANVTNSYNWWVVCIELVVNWPMAQVINNFLIGYKYAILFI